MRTLKNFITNSDNSKTLGERINKLMSRSEELKFLVGFFYFSGIKQFYDTLKKLYDEGKLKEEHIKVLVGLYVDKGNYGLYEVAKKATSNDEYVEELINSIKLSFTSEELDTEEIYNQAEFFIKLLEERKLVIRKTREPNHSKLYLFKIDEVSTPHLFITGSSNLTKAGLISQNEFNVEMKDYGFTEAEEYFDELWKNSVELSQDNVEKLINAFRNDTFLRKVSPFTAYVYLLKTYLDTHESKQISKDFKKLMKKKGYENYSYQSEAISQAIANCEAHGGTILADVVGLGKTVVACMVAKALGKRGIVLAPPHLIGTDDKSTGWKKYLEDFELYVYGWEVWSIGKLEEALKVVREHDNIEVVIVDEAHRFRNENTVSYHYLKEICRGKTVLLLTATPFNNSPSDIFSLLKLFTIPKKSTIVFDENLKYKFDEYERLFSKLSYISKNYDSKDKNKIARVRNYYSNIFVESKIDMNKVRGKVKEIARHVRAILEPVVIRRNRLDLKHYDEKIDFPEVKDPIEWFYELTKEQSEFYDEVIRAFNEARLGGRFKGAIYMPIIYERDILDEEVEEVTGEEFEEKSNLRKEERFTLMYQRNLYNFMRRLLVKRFESSFGSFYKSVERFKSINEKALNFIKKTNKFILDRELIEDLAEKDEEEILKKLEEYEESLEKGKTDSPNYKVYDLDKFKYKNEFIRNIEGDIKLFDEFLTKMKSLKLIESDSKAERLIKGIEEYLKENRKVVIFTEYVDTAKHLDTILKSHFKDIVLSAFGNISKTTFEEIVKNFDAQYKEQEDKYKILLTTDKLSEGYNLNRAGVVINYDIPWNPVRVIQRVGRINRIGKKVYDEIYIVNFFPTEKGADIIKSREIAQAKMFMIHNILGEDAKIFDPSEEPKESELYKRLNQYIEEEESFFTKVRNEFEEIKKKYPEVVEKIQNMPKRIKTSKRADKNELMVFVRKGKDLFVGYKDYLERQPKVVSFEEVYEKIKATPETEALEVSKSFWENYRIVLNKEAYIRRKASPNDIENKAINLLNDLKNREIGELKTFVQSLIKDIREYYSISEYIVRKIVDLEDYLKAGDLEKVKSELEKIKKEVGNDFIEKVENQLKILEASNQEVIIAIENQGGA